MATPTASVHVECDQPLVCSNLSLWYRRPRGTDVVADAGAAGCGGGDGDAGAGRGAGARFPLPSCTVPRGTSGAPPSPTSSQHRTSPLAPVTTGRPLHFLGQDVLLRSAHARETISGTRDPARTMTMTGIGIGIGIGIGSAVDGQKLVEGTPSVPRREPSRSLTSIAPLWCPDRRAFLYCGRSNGAFLLSDLSLAVASGECERVEQTQSHGECGWKMNACLSLATSYWWLTK